MHQTDVWIDDPPLATAAAVPLQGVTALFKDVQDSARFQVMQSPSSLSKFPTSLSLAKEPE